MEADEVTQMPLELKNLSQERAEGVAMATALVDEEVFPERKLVALQLYGYCVSFPSNGEILNSLKSEIPEI